MPRDITVTFSDGTTHVYKNAPDDVTPEDVTARAEQEFSKSVSALDGGRGSPSPKANPQPDPEPEPVYEEEPYLPDGHPDASTIIEVTPEWLEQQEADYQASLAAKKNGQYAFEAPASPSVPSGGSSDLSLASLAKGLEYSTGAIVEGLGDTAGIVTNPISTLIGRAMGYDNYTADLGGELRDTLGLDRPKEGDTANRIAGDIVSGAAGGLGFAGGAKLTGKAVQGVVAQRALAELGATPVRDAVAGGTAALASDAVEEAGGGAVAQTAAALVGGAAGYGASGLAKNARPSVRAEKWAQREFDENPYAAFDAEIADDIANLTKNRPGSKRGKKPSRGQLAIRTVNKLENSYQTRFKDLVTASDLPKSEKLRLKGILDSKEVVLEDELASIRGTVEGDAIADAITKIQRLRTLTEKPASKTNIGGKVAEGVALASDVAPLLGMPGTFGGASAGLGVLRKFSRNSNSVEKVRIDAVDDILKKRRGYEKLRELTGPSGARESYEAFWNKTTGALDAKEAEKNVLNLSEDLQLENVLEKQKAKAATKKLKADNKRVGVINDRDNVKPGGGYRGIVYDRTGLLPAEQDAGLLKMLANGKITPEQFDAFLKAPDKLMNGNAGNAIADRLSAMAEEGVLKRDPKWKPPEPQAQLTAPMVDAKGRPIKSMPAYQGGIQKNIARELQLLQELDEIDPVVAVMGEGDEQFSTRASELGQLSPEELAKANALRAQIADLKKPKK